MGLRRTHLEHDIRLRPEGARVVYDLGALFTIGVIGVVGGGARSGLDRNRKAQLRELLGGLRRRGYAIFVRVNFPGYSDFHRLPLLYD